MSEKDLGQALLRLDAAQLSGVPDMREQIARVLARDRRRVKLWTLLTASIWVVAVVLVLGILVFFGLLFPMMAKLRHGVAGNFPEEQRAQLLEDASVAFMMATVLIAVSVGVLAAAALSTVFLLFASRRATLRQVSANLMEVSEQVKQLRELLARQPPTT
jgi:ABC-type Fe3+-siderophore transport system permease subunit